MSNEWRDLPTMADVAAAQAAGDEIEVNVPNCGWEPWVETMWHELNQYRARPRKPKMKKVKMLCWFINGHLNWLQEGNHTAGPDWKSVPSEDKEIEVEE